jgi:hypothetical protein
MDDRNRFDERLPALGKDDDLTLLVGNVRRRYGRGNASYFTALNIKEFVTKSRFHPEKPP